VRVLLSLLVCRTLIIVLAILSFILVLSALHFLYTLFPFLSIGIPILYVIPSIPMFSHLILSFQGTVNLFKTPAYVLFLIIFTPLISSLYLFFLFQLIIHVLIAHTLIFTFTFLKYFTLVINVLLIF